MRKSIQLVLTGIFLTAQLFAQMSREEWDRINKLSQQDHQLMMERLGITELRPGPSGNPQAPNAANADESRASPYTSLPDPLVFKDGTKVNTAEQWERRRLEIMEEHLLSVP